MLLYLLAIGKQLAGGLQCKPRCQSTPKGVIQKNCCEVLKFDVWEVSQIRFKFTKINLMRLKPVVSSTHVNGKRNL